MSNEGDLLKTTQTYRHPFTALVLTLEYYLSSRFHGFSLRAPGPPVSYCTIQPNAE